LPLLLDHEHLLHRLDRRDILRLLNRFGATTFQASGPICPFTQETFPLLLLPEASSFTFEASSSRSRLL
jgi:hypothetical protein